MLKYLFLVISAIFLIGCGGAQPKPGNSLPEWVVNSQPSSVIYYRAVGEGISKEEAKKSALQQISSEISVTISSQTTSKSTAIKSSTQDTFNREIQDVIKSSTQKIKFTGVKVLKNAFIDGKYYADVEVNREVLFQAQKDAMLIKYNELQKLWKKIDSSNIFAIFTQNSKLNKMITSVMAQLPILKSINPNFDLRVYSNVIQNIRSKAMAKKADAIVYVKTNNAFNEKIVLEKAITDFGIKVVKKLSNVKNKNNLMIITIDKNSRVAINRYKTMKMRGVKFAAITLTITTYDGRGKTELAKNIIYLKNASRDSYKDAVKKTKKFERLIKQKGILNILLENLSK